MKIHKIVAVGACALSLVGCRTDKQILADYESAIYYGDYAGATVEVTQKANAGGGSEQMWRLLSASAYYMADDKVAAVDMFDKAEEVFRRNDQRSVFTTVGEGTWAMLANEKSFDYDGGGLDREFTCIYRAIDFMAATRPDEARVELNRLTQYQTNWLYDREKEIVAAQERLEKDIAAYEKEKKAKAKNRDKSVDKALADASFMRQIESQCNFDPARSGNLSTLSQADYMNIYGLHLTGLFRWLAGDSDRNELRDAANFAPANLVAARDAAERREGVMPRNQVWVYVEDGLCPIREEKRFDLPLIFVPFANRYAPYVGMALPGLKLRTQAAANWSVESGTESSGMSQLDDIDRLVKCEFDVYFRGALKREITRTVTKAGVQIALGVLCDNVRDDSTRIALRGSQYAVALWAAATTAADLRSWTTLPKSVYMTRIDRPADGVIRLKGNGAIVAEIHVQEGNSIIFVRKTSPSAPAVIKTAYFN